MQLTSYLVFNGHAEEAAHFYANVLEGAIGNLYRYDSMPAQEGMPEVPEGFGQKVLHCCLTFPGGAMGMADTLPADPRNFGHGGHMLTLACDSIAQAEEVYAKLCVDAQKIACELNEVYYAKQYGEVVDRYGVQWTIMYEEK